MEDDHRTTNPKVPSNGERSRLYPLFSSVWTHLVVVALIVILFPSLLVPCKVGKVD